MVLRALWLSVLQNTQFVVTTLTLFWILRIRSAHALWFGLGTLIAAFSAKVLKKFIRQPRPTTARKFEKTYGMPSTHSSSIAYFAEAVLFIRGLMAIGFIFGATSVCWSRVKLGHHTKAQVLVGAGLGISVAFVWFLIWFGLEESSILFRINSSLPFLIDERIPSVLRLGMREKGPVWESAVEDSIFLLVEIWQGKEWHRLSELARFPILIKDEL